MDIGEGGGGGGEQNPDVGEQNPGIMKKIMALGEYQSSTGGTTQHLVATAISVITEESVKPEESEFLIEAFLIDKSFQKSQGLFV